MRAVDETRAMSGERGGSHSIRLSDSFNEGGWTERAGLNSIAPRRTRSPEGDATISIARVTETGVAMGVRERCGSCTVLKAAKDTFAGLGCERW